MNPYKRYKQPHRLHQPSIEDHKDLVLGLITTIAKSKIQEQSDILWCLKLTRKLINEQYDKN